MAKNAKQSKSKKFSTLKNIPKTSQHRVTTNPFELRQNKKQKHEVLNRRVKGSVRNVLLSKTTSIRNRSARLTNELKNSTKSNKFEDSRFGEQSNAISEEEKLLHRFQKSRSKKARYNLDSGNDAVSQIKEQLTHLGQSLGKSSKKGDNTLSEDETDLINELEQFSNPEDEQGGGNFDAMELMQRLRENRTFALEDLDGGKKRSRKEIFEEVMMKSKIFKAEQQRLKDQLEEQREKNDELFEQLLINDGSKSTGLDFKPSKGMRIDDMTEKQKQWLIDEKQRHIDNGQDYEKMIKDLRYDARATATEKTMTPEEKALKENEKLKYLQEELDKRTKKRFEEDDFDGRRKQRKSTPDNPVQSNTEGSPQIDAFGNDVIETGLIVKLQEDDNLSKTYSTDEPVTSSSRLSKKEIPAIEYSEELPFVIDVPESHLQFVQLCRRYETINDSFSTIIERISKTNSVHLRAENKDKMTRFYKILVTHVCYLAEYSTQHERNGRFNSKGSDIFITFYWLHKLGVEINKNIGEIYINRVQKMNGMLYAQLSRVEDLSLTGKIDCKGGDFGSSTLKDGIPHEIDGEKKKGGHKGKKGEKLIIAEESEFKSHQFYLYNSNQIYISSTRVWPSASDLVFLQLVCSVFAVSNYSHLVVSPTIILIGQYLSYAPVRGTKDLISCLALLQVTLEYTKRTIKGKCSSTDGSTYGALLPEAFAAISAILGQVAMKTPNSSSNIYITLPLTLNANKCHTALVSYDSIRSQIALLDNLFDSDANTVLPLRVLKCDKEEKPSEMGGIILCCLISLIEQFVTLCAPLSLCESVLARLKPDLEQLLSTVKNESIFIKLEQLLTQMTFLERNVILKRGYLTLFDDKAKEIRILDPEFSLDYNWSNNDEKDKHKQEVKKLRKQIKREEKGVAKEIRKDALFINAQKLKEQKVRKQELSVERKSNLRFLEELNQNINNAVKAGQQISGGGTRDVNMRGRKRK